jgi:hypothetical protein
MTIARYIFATRTVPMLLTGAATTAVATPTGCGIGS